MGGGNHAEVDSAVKGAGLSPRGRGKPNQRLLCGQALGSIPAWAGETVNSWRAERVDEVYPRVGGGNWSVLWCSRGGQGLSPRGRGKRCRSRSPRRSSRSIPAWAGETLHACIDASAREVYPRVGGGNDAAENTGQLIKGLSPRGRGKPTSA